MLEPGDIRDMIIELRDSEDDTVTWKALMNEATTRGHKTADVEKAITAAKNNGLIIEPLLGTYETL